jgi:tRNA A37 N6-isopentenylltransferase MiaA
VARSADFACVCLTGPTACGKTDLALRLAERLPLEVISMDSAMVYRGLTRHGKTWRRSVRRCCITSSILEPNEAYWRASRDGGAHCRSLRAGATAARR